MKKLILSAIVVLFSFTFANAQNDLPAEMTPDMKYWFSETQLKNSVELASKTHIFVKRCYIDGVEFTEQGYTRYPNGPKDAKLVVRISGSDTEEHVTKFIFAHPDDMKDLLFIRANAQFIKY